MRRALLLVLFLGLALSAGAQAGPGGLPGTPREVPGNPLAGHQVQAEFPGLVLVQTANKIGVTWDGPLVLLVDGRPAARIALPTASGAFPGAQALPWWRTAALAGLGGALGALLGGIVKPTPGAIMAGLAIGAGGGAGAGLTWFLAERLPPRIAK